MGWTTDVPHVAQVTLHRFHSRECDIGGRPAVGHIARRVAPLREGSRQAVIVFGSLLHQVWLAKTNQTNPSLAPSVQGVVIWFIFPRPGQTKSCLVVWLAQIQSPLSYFGNNIFLGITSNSWLTLDAAYSRISTSSKKLWDLTQKQTCNIGLL